MTLREVLRETLRLWWNDPAGMLAVILGRVFFGSDYSNERLERVLREDEARRQT